MQTDESNKVDGDFHLLRRLNPGIILRDKPRLGSGARHRTSS
jgi:hypothetical protein